MQEKGSTSKLQITQKANKNGVTRKWKTENEGNYVQFRDTNRQILKIKADQNRE